MNLLVRLKKHPQYKALEHIATTLNGAGFKALLAGGAVRDLLLKRMPKDLDLATDASPEKVISLFPKTVSVGAQFGIVVVVHEGQSIEVARFRQDGPYEDGRRPQSVIFSDEKEDAQRRDFTINALFLDLKNKKIIDYVGGKNDLDHCLIQTVGEPEKRFYEDHLRILRALRFHSELGFQIEARTLAVIEKEAVLVKKVSDERISQELQKLLRGKNAYHALELCKNLKILNHLWPHVDWKEVSFYSFIIPKKRTQLEALYLWLQSFCNITNFESMAKTLKLSNEQTKKLKTFFHLSELYRSPEEVRWGVWWTEIAESGGVEWLKLMKKMGWISRDYDQRLQSKLVLPPAFLKGGDLLSLGVPQQNIGKILKELYYLQLEEKIQSKDEALHVLRSQHLA